jgi:hypothetical protein
VLVSQPAQNRQGNSSIFTTSWWMVEKSFAKTPRVWKKIIESSEREID